MDTGLAPASIVDAGFSRVAQWVGTGTREPPHLVRGHLRPQPRTLVAKVASYLSMTTVFERLSAGLEELLSYAQTRNVRLSFDPEAGMLIDTMARFERLHASMNHPWLGLTLDVGHVHCLDDGDCVQHVQRWRDVLWNVHIEDMRRGVHEHLIFGDGDMDFGSVFDALRQIDYTGPIHVELPRHSHNAVETARRAYEFLTRWVK